MHNKKEHTKKLSIMWKRRNLLFVFWKNWKVQLKVWNAASLASLMLQEKKAIRKNINN